MKNLLFYFLILSLGTFVACESEVEDAREDVAEAQEEVNDAMEELREEQAELAEEMREAGMPDLTDPATVVQAVQNAGGLTKLDPSTAVAVIDGYVAKLSGMDGTDGITSKLRELKGELTQSSIDGSKVGALLKDLGMNTTNVGQGNAALMQLGQALTQAGNNLSN